MSSLKSIYIYLFSKKSLKLVGPNIFYINEKLLSLKIIHFEINIFQEKTILQTQKLNKKWFKWTILFLLLYFLLLLCLNLFFFMDYSLQKYISVLLFFL